MQTGGPLGGCLPASSLNTPVDFDSLQEAGAVMGCGGMIVVDDDTCMVELAKYFLTFATAESCGKCVPCRIGGQRLLEILTRITEGEGTRKDLETIRGLSNHMSSSSLCGLGQRTAGPVMSVLRFFEKEMLAHIDEQDLSVRPVQKTRARQMRQHLSRPAWTRPRISRSSRKAAMPRAWRFIANAIRSRSSAAALVRRFAKRNAAAAEIDEPIAIRMTKRFMAEHESQQPWTPEPLGTPEQRRVASEKKVAVIGSGPAGLTAAVRLAQMGYGVTVFEKLSVPGGMMSCAIPEYRLPREPLFLEIENIKRAGVEIRCNESLGKDFTLDELLDKRGFHSVVIAIGAHTQPADGYRWRGKKWCHQRPGFSPRSGAGILLP